MRFRTLKSFLQIAPALCIHTLNISTIRWKHGKHGRKITSGWFSTMLSQTPPTEQCWNIKHAWCGLCKQGSFLRRAENIIMWIYLMKITHISQWVWVTATPLNDGCSLRSLQQARSESFLTVMMLHMIICLGMYLRKSTNTCCLVMMVQSLSTSIKRASVFLNARCGHGSWKTLFMSN